MDIVSVSDIYHNKIKKHTLISVRGWVKNRRNSKSGISFIDLYDGSCFDTIQVVVHCSLFNFYQDIIKLTVGCSMIVHGILIKSLKKNQLYEINAKTIKIVGLVNDPSSYPMSSKRHTIEHLRQYSHLRPRTNFIGSISRIRNCLFQTLHQFLYKKGYYWIATPIITGLNAEGCGDMFKVSTLDFSNLSKTDCSNINFKKDFFGRESFLSVSGQLNLEAYACALSKVYSFGPTFRAENSNTSRHLAEFWMLEVETAFSTLNDLVSFSEEMLKHAVNNILDQCLIDIEFFKKTSDTDIISRLQQFSKRKFVQIEYEEVINILKKSGQFSLNSIFSEMDLLSEHEKYIVEQYFGCPVIIVNYPRSIKAFYMKLNKDGKTVAAMDLLVPKIGEILGGSEREEKLDILDKRFSEFGLNKKNYWWYRDLRKYGTVPHAGFGLGFERFLSYIIGVKNIRDVCPFPRTVNNISV
ncbi:MAG: asparagine--tRNA ligase [Buchnera aphidicola (Meitanaphis flavogallis)]